MSGCKCVSLNTVYTKNVQQFYKHHRHAEYAHGLIGACYRTIKNQHV